MADVAGEIGRAREDQYFLKQEQQLLEEMRRKSVREAETLRLMEVCGIRDPELVRELADAGFDVETFRSLYLVPLIRVAWSDGGVSQREADLVLEIASLHGIKAGSAAYDRLVAWLTGQPSERFFQACLRGVKAMLWDRPPSEADALSRDLVWYCTRIASAAGGFLGLGSRISREEERMLAHLARELEMRHHAATGRVTVELAASQSGD